MVKNPPASAGEAGDAGWIPESGRSPGEEMATHPRILAGKSHGPGAWGAAVHGVPKSWLQVNFFFFLLFSIFYTHTHTHTHTMLMQTCKYRHPEPFPFILSAILHTFLSLTFFTQFTRETVPPAHEVLLLYDF